MQELTNSEKESVIRYFNHKFSAKMVKKTKLGKTLGLNPTIFSNMNNEKHWHKVGRPTWNYLYKIYKNDSFTAAMSGELEKYESPRKNNFSVPKSLEKKAAANDKKKDTEQITSETRSFLNSKEKFYNMTYDEYRAETGSSLNSKAKKLPEKTNPAEKLVEEIKTKTNQVEYRRKHTIGEFIDKMIESGVRVASIEMDNVTLRFETNR
jgi:flagellar hook-associated protein FlgK